MSVDRTLEVSSVGSYRGDSGSRLDMVTGLLALGAYAVVVASSALHSSSQRRSMCARSVFFMGMILQSDLQRRCLPGLDTQC